MKESLNLKSKSGIHRLISALEERGFIKESHQSIEEAYTERLVLYEKYADYSVTNNSSVEACVQKIISLLDL